MNGAKLTCPKCEMMLVAPQPMATGTPVTCPRCGACFGLPELGHKVPRAESVSAPAIVQARPVPPVSAVAAAAPAHPPRSKPATVAPVTDSLNFDEPCFPNGADLPAPTSTQSSATPKETKHRRKKRADPMVKWLLIGSGVVLLVAVIIVGVVVLLPEKQPHARSTSREPNAPNSAGEEKKTGVNESAGKADRRGAAPARAAKNSKARTAGTDKKDKASDKMAQDNDSDAPIPIPGLGPAKPKQPAPPP